QRGQLGRNTHNNGLATIEVFFFKRRRWRKGWIPQTIAKSRRSSVHTAKSRSVVVSTPSSSASFICESAHCLYYNFLNTLLNHIFQSTKKNSGSISGHHHSHFIDHIPGVLHSTRFNSKEECSPHIAEFASSPMLPHFPLLGCILIRCYTWISGDDVVRCHCWRPLCL